MSISQNFLNNFHFIQTSRPWEINMVVPPGLPIILTVLCFICNTTYFVVFFQYLLFGFSCVLFYKAIFNFFPKSSNSKIIAGLIGVITYCFSYPVLFDTASPRYILTEPYTQFIFISILYILSIPQFDFEKKSKLLIPILFIGSLIRPLLFSLLILDVLVYIIFLIKNKHSFKFLLLFLLTASIILSVNALLNYRETGEFVLMQNYGGVSFYQANNPNTSTQPYDSTKMEQFSDGYFLEIYKDNTMTTSEKSNIFMSDAKNWIFNNLKQFLLNTFIKFQKLFIIPYQLDFYIWSLGSLFLYFVTRKKEFLFLIISVFLLMFLTSMGLNIYRYSIFANIFYIFIKITILVYVLDKLISLFISRKK